jgi:hypothetical protein
MRAFQKMASAGVKSNGNNKFATTAVDPDDVRVDTPFVACEEEGRFQLRVPLPLRDPEGLVVGPHIKKQATDAVRDFNVVKLGKTTSPKQLPIWRAITS